MVGIAVSGAQRKATKVEHREHIGIELLIRQAEADDVEVTERVARLQAIEWNAIAAQVEFKVRPGAEYAFREQVGAAVDAVVEHLQTEIAAAKLINVGKCQRYLGMDGRVLP